MTEKDMSCKSPSKKAGIATHIAYKVAFKECTLVLIRRILYEAKGSINNSPVETLVSILLIFSSFSAYYYNTSF